jgi:hypothetical protein
MLIGNTQDTYAASAATQTITTYTGAAAPKTPAGQYWVSIPYYTSAPGNQRQNYNTIDMIQLGSIWYATKQWRIYEMWVDYSFNDDPAAPTANAAVNLGKPRPSVTWTTSDTENDAILLHDTYYYTETQRQAAGFYPGMGGYAARTTVLVNGLNGGPLTTYTVTPSVDLANNTTFRSYSRVTQVPQQRISGWGTSGPIAVAFESPIVPLITATPDVAHGRVQLVVQGQDNLLTFDESTSESAGSTTWSNQNISSLAKTNTQFQWGAQSLQGTSGAAGDMKIITYPDATHLKPATPGQIYSAIGWFKRTSASGNRSCRVEITFYNSSFTAVGGGAGAQTAVPNTWTMCTYQSTAPAGTAWVGMSMDVLACVAAGEVYCFDSMYLAPGTNITDWSPGSMTASTGYVGPSNGVGQTILIERTADGGNTWTTVRPAPYASTLTGVPSSALAYGTQLSAAIYDYEAPLQTSVQYRATTVTTFAIGDPANPSSAQPSTLSSITSGMTTATTLTAPPSGRGFWLKNVLGGGWTLEVDIIDNTFQLTFPIQDATYNPLGRPDPVVVTDVANTVQGSMTFEFTSDFTWQVFRDAFYKTLVTQLLQKYDGQQWYIQFLSGGTLEEFNGPSPIYRTFKTKWVEVSRP